MVEIPARTDTSQEKKEPNGEKGLSAKGPRPSLAKNLNILFELQKDAVASDVEKGTEDKGNGSGGRLITSLKIFFSNVNVPIWRDFYGSFGVLVMLLLGNESVWKTQMEVLRSPAQMGRPKGDPGGDPYDGPGGGGDGKGRRSSDSLGLDPLDPLWSGDDDFLDQAAREFKDIVQAESNRVSVAVSPRPLYTEFINLTSTRAQ